ncbi:uncharacterized protein LOC104584628 [Brachypodium distachyon]|uniref:uncharacterized protein LOC104584628 n=1 Tax=Brachypodium distachyon TaxID=15368 RepID=UPI000D0D2FE7|nr:uncharacterized protein LOC104584628 [Brachypodium distachyon]|eukprot:XP_024310929.1 uncharacterized protein LOC104584628 [Brachypodium distachyon]
MGEERDRESNLWAGPGRGADLYGPDQSAKLLRQRSEQCNSNNRAPSREERGGGAPSSRLLLFPKHGGGRPAGGTADALHLTPVPNNCSAKCLAAGPRTRQTRERPPRPAGRNTRTASAPSRTLLQHVLSFLPSRLAVGTCVLARRWRHQWKSVPVLRLPWFDIERAQPPHSFVNHLLLLRDRVPLRECEIDTYEGTVDISPLILYALLFRVQYIFRKDMKKGPSFGKLKTLMLNEWCFAAKFGALLYFLQHSPVLEKLSLELHTTSVSSRR